MSSSSLIDTISQLLYKFMPAGLALAGAVLIVLRRKQVTKRTVITATASFLLFEALFISSYRVAYAAFPDTKLMLIYLLFGALGAVPIVLKLYFLGHTFLAGSAAGWLLDCALSAGMNPLEPNMSAGAANLAALVFGSLLAIILELIYQLAVKKRGTRKP